MSGFDHERVAREIAGEIYASKEELEHGVRESWLRDSKIITEILRREYKELEVMLVNCKVALRMHSDNIASLKVKLAKAAKTLHWYGRECSEYEYAAEYGKRACETLKEIGDDL